MSQVFFPVQRKTTLMGGENNKDDLGAHLPSNRTSSSSNYSFLRCISEPFAGCMPGRPISRESAPHCTESFHPPHEPQQHQGYQRVITGWFFFFFFWKFSLSPFGSSDGLGLGGEGGLVGEGVGIRVDDSENIGRSPAKAQHVKHHHVLQELGNSPAGSAERATGVLTATAACWITAETQSHSLGGCNHHRQRDGYCQQANKFEGQHAVWQKEPV